VVTEVTLRDGSRGFVWPLIHEDRRELASLYEGLDAASKYNRFLSAVPRLTDGMLTRLVDVVDGVDHVALVLTVFGEDWVGTPAGIARMIRYAEDGAAADVAVTVRQGYRGRGAASVLLRELVTQRPAGVERLVTHVAVDNAASLAMLRALGPTQVIPGGGTFEVRVELPPP
jgi:ribosomal protein S18 acetylase RimI-like enzyme